MAKKLFLPPLTSDLDVRIEDEEKKHSKAFLIFIHDYLFN